MRVPRVRFRIWWLMVAVAAAAILAWGLRRDGVHALAWQAPMLGASLAMGRVGKPWRLAAGLLGGGVAGGALATGGGIGGAVAATALAMDVGIGGAVAGAIAGLFAAWVATI